jgi:hypothetical protein
MEELNDIEPVRPNRSITIILYAVLFPAIICGLLSVTLSHIHLSADLKQHGLDWSKMLVQSLAYIGIFLVIAVLSVVMATKRKRRNLRAQHIPGISSERKDHKKARCASEEITLVLPLERQK